MAGSGWYRVHTSQAGQVGVESLEPANVIWETEIKARLKQLLAP